METGTIQVYYGEGQGKTSAAIGHAIRRASEGQSIYIVQFMKCKMNTEYLKRCEPEIKLFRFERSEKAFGDLTEEEKANETVNIVNGLNFAKKALVTGECDLLILDEVLGLIDEGVIDETELLNVLSAKGLFTSIIITGRNITSGLIEKADSVLNVKPEK